MIKIISTILSDNTSDDMQRLIDLRGKEKKYVIGLMSGTSVDGVDAALVEITGNWIETQINLIGYIEHPYPDGLKELILRNSVKETSNVKEISQLNFLLPQIYTEAINHLLSEINFDAGKIDLIGCHGQTIHHVPKHEAMFDHNVSSTLQISDPSVLAKLTGKIVVGNFRTGDMALGGQGAPLVPYFDYLMFHSAERSRGLLNIGGISNITILKKNCSQSDVLAFDIGPGNMMIDSLMQKFFAKNFDDRGDTAKSGKLNDELFNALIEQDEFIESPPPKSTGREYYGDEFLDSLQQEFSDIPNEDWLHTITKFTAYGVYRNYEKFVSQNIVIDELIVSGGGAKNSFLYELLHEYFGDGVEVKVIDEIGLSSDAKEAICFAVLANETIHGNPSNIPKTTGASRATILGQICLP